MAAIKGVIFDLDGTLIDSMKMWNGIDRQFLMENGVEDPPHDISDKMRKMTVEESSRYFIEHFGLDCTVEYVTRRIEELVRIQYEEKIPLKPQVSDLLDLLEREGIPFGVATATYRSLAQAVLKRHGILERMSFVLTDEEFPVGKAKPDIFLHAAELMNIRPFETLVVEDSLHCIETASSAGFLTAAVYDETSSAEAEAIRELADWYLETLGEAEKIVRQENNV